MPRYQPRLLRAVVAVTALVAAVGGEAAVGRALAHRGAEATGRSEALLRARAVSEVRASRAEDALRAALTGRPPGAPLTAPALPGTPLTAPGLTAPGLAGAVPGAAAEGSPAVRPGLPDVPAAAVLRALPARLDRDGAAIDVGRAGAPVTVTLYEDYRCPDCRRFEEAQGAVLARLAAAGTVLVRRVVESSLDVRLPGDGAHRAANAARAALAAGGFPLYNALLYAEQPPEQEDGYTVGRLLALASRVPGLRGPAFDRAVRTRRYAPWAAAAQRAYERHGRRAGYGTPGMVVNGRPVDLAARPDLAGDPGALRAFLLAQARR
ncbi:thioredoxin domain-containing protein [Streptacidiphilus sp. ASG 303]|uniref:DsbA family protein n=1 Tax=Streptacidiphilus sp. ASG 303 TaxID=2896847 RepID=UPI001E5B75F7|nr:thioredoxin domain-containing protein [Streptacidiphilus sp. ASG 303]MCD0481575.1 thioredoxin domain-containing protein [Streptacidiphilus sp. ASG 303]